MTQPAPTPATQDFPGTSRSHPSPLAGLERENLQIRAVLDAIGVGVAAWDEDGVLTLSNTRLAELFMVPPAALWPGLPLLRFVALLEQGGVLEEPDAGGLGGILTALLEHGEAASFVQRLSDGRLLNVDCSRFGLNGWLTTYEDVTKRERDQARLAFQAQHDGLTKLANRTLLHERLAEAVGRIGTIAVLCLDLDRFKAVNDVIGHHGGDILLRTVAARLTNCHRQGDTVARLGGDEFAVVLGMAATPEEAADMAERVIRTLSQPFDIEGQVVSVGASVGIAMAPRDGRDAESLLHAADRALYLAKSAGRGTYRFFDRELEARSREQAELEHDLRVAVHNGEIEMLYQPLVRCVTGTVSGFEALMRWRHPTRGMVPPARFIPLAESCGLISALGRFALERACADAMTWPSHLRVAVNLSPAQLRLDDVAATVGAALAASGLPASRLEVEVTESVLIQDDEATRTVLHGLKAAGVRIAMDDFGTGYSSLSYIQKFPFDKIKIDKSFVDGIGRGPGPEAIVRAVIDIAASLNIETVAEGVETREQYERLAAKRCDHVQGFLFSQPRQANAVTRMVEVIDKFMALAPARPRQEKEPPQRSESTRKPQIWRGSAA